MTTKGEKETAGQIISKNTWTKIVEWMRQWGKLSQVSTLVCRYMVVFEILVRLPTLVPLILIIDDCCEALFLSPIVDDIDIHIYFPKPPSCNTAS